MTQSLDRAPGLAAVPHPGGQDADARALGAVCDLVGAGNVVILSGAGLSTESGIPDYRGPSGRARRAQPMSYQAFTASHAARQRYWARSYLGWQHVARAAPNAGHHAVAALGRAGLLAGIITQNVDGLHQAAGSHGVLELHGSLSRVACLDCGERSSRLRLQERLRAASPHWDAVTAGLTPDGDAVIDDEQARGFRIVDCESCGGVVKPDVVFFGENVPPPRVAECYAMVESASALLVLGTSLTVMSGFRFVRHAAKLAVPVVIINQGITRGDACAAITIDAPLGAALTRLSAQVRAGR